MKRSPVMMLAALLLVGLTGCGSSWQKQFSVQCTPAEQVLTQEKITAAYHAAAEAYDWFDLTTMPLDTSDSKQDAGWRFATFCPSDNLDRNADTVYTFSYDGNTFCHTDFDKYGDLELCCYLVNADGAFAESPFDILTRRFLKDPEHMMEALALVEESPWEHKDSMISGIGYNAVYSFTMGDRIEFETLLKSSTPAQSDAEQAVWNLISTAYEKGAADQEANAITPRQ